MKPFLALVFVLSASVFSSASASAQTFSPRTIRFDGVPQYAPVDLLALTGLSPGKAITKDDIEAAMHRLDDSGLFGGIQYTTGNGELHFALEPATADRMQSVRFSNFVWYTQDQLNEVVHHRVPLYAGSVPGEGDMTVRVQHALEAILKERGINATVTSQSVKGGKLEYSISSPAIVVGELKILGVRFDSDPVLTSVRQGLVGADYLEGISTDAVRMNLSYALEELGYLDEIVGPVAHSEPKAISATGADKIVVDLTGSAKLGERYKVARVEMPPLTGGMSAKEFESDAQVKAGGLPSPSLVKNTIFRVGEVFGKYGYLAAVVTVEPSKDAAAHTVSYTFKAVPGDVYSMRSLVFTGLVTSVQQSQLTQAWKLPQGAVFNGQLVTQFRMAGPMRTLCNGRPGSVRPVLDKVTHQVDVNLGCAITQ